MGHDVHLSPHAEWDADVHGEPEREHSLPYSLSQLPLGWPPSETLTSKAAADLARANLSALGALPLPGTCLTYPRGDYPDPYASTITFLRAVLADCEEHPDWFVHSY